MTQSWKTVSLLEVCEITSNLVDPREPEYIDLPHIGAGNMVTQSDDLIEVQTAREEGLKSNKFCFDSSMILYSKIRPYLMKVSRPDFVGVCSADVYPLRPSDSMLDKDYLFHLLLTRDFTDYAIAGSARAGMPKVNRNHLFAYEFELPPLPEQKRIVAILDEAFEGIDTAIANAEKNLANARELFESYLDSVFSDPDDDWVATTVGNEVDLLPGFAFKSANYSDADDGVKLLRGDNIMQGTLRWDGVKKWPHHDAADYEKFWLSEGDVVLAMDRPWVNAGLKRAMIESSDLPCLLVQRVARLRAKKGFDCRFLYYLVSSPIYIDHLLGKQTGIGVPHISGKQIQSFGFKKPSLTEQIAIGNDLDEMEQRIGRLEKIYQRKLKDLAELKQSTLQKAFSGELTKRAA